MEYTKKVINQIEGLCKTRVVKVPNCGEDSESKVHLEPIRNKVLDSLKSIKELYNEVVNNPDIGIFNKGYLKELYNINLVKMPFEKSSREFNAIKSHTGFELEKSFNKDLLLLYLRNFEGDIKGARLIKTQKLKEITGNFDGEELIYKNHYNKLEKVKKEDFKLQDGIAHFKGEDGYLHNITVVENTILTRHVFETFLFSDEVINDSNFKNKSSHLASKEPKLYFNLEQGLDFSKSSGTLYITKNPEDIIVFNLLNFRNVVAALNQNSIISLLNKISNDSDLGIKKVIMISDSLYDLKQNIDIYFDFLDYLDVKFTAMKTPKNILDTFIYEGDWRIKEMLNGYMDLDYYIVGRYAAMGKDKKNTNYFYLRLLEYYSLKYSLEGHVYISLGRKEAKEIIERNWRNISMLIGSSEKNKALSQDHLRLISDRGYTSFDIQEELHNNLISAFAMLYLHKELTISKQNGFMKIAAFVSKKFSDKYVVDEWKKKICEDKESLYTLESLYIFSRRLIDYYKEFSHPKIKEKLFLKKFPEYEKLVNEIENYTFLKRNGNGFKVTDGFEKALNTYMFLKDFLGVKIQVEDIISNRLREEEEDL